MRTRPLNLRMIVHLHSRNPESSRSLQVSEAWLFITVPGYQLETLGLRMRRLEEFLDLNPHPSPPLESFQARYSHTWAYKVSTVTAGDRGTTNPESTPDPQNEKSFWATSLRA